MAAAVAQPAEALVERPAAAQAAAQAESPVVSQVGAAAEAVAAMCPSRPHHDGRRSSETALQIYSSPAPALAYDVAFKRSYASRINRPYRSTWPEPL